MNLQIKTKWLVTEQDSHIYKKVTIFVYYQTK